MSLLTLTYRYFFKFRQESSELGGMRLWTSTAKLLDLLDRLAMVVVLVKYEEWFHIQLKLNPFMENGEAKFSRDYVWNSC